MDDFQKMRHQLLLRLSAGEIDKNEYEWTLAEITRHQSDLNAASNHSDVMVQPDNEGDRIHPGMILGNHTVKRLLGSGGMGEVWLTYEMIRDCNFFSVIKLLLPAAASDDETRRLLEIFHKVRLLQHEHICPVYSIGYDDRVGYYFVMKYVEGVTLAQRAGNADRPLPTGSLVEILRSVARPLDYAHSRGIVHRDIKPSNIMINEDLDEVQVVDFGLCARVHDIGTTLKGSPGNMAPKQWTGDSQDGRTDQFALAVVAYELIAGRLPSCAPDAHIGQLILTEEPPVITAAKSGVKRSASSILRKVQG